MRYITIKYPVDRLNQVIPFLFKTACIKKIAFLNSLYSITYLKKNSRLHTKLLKQILTVLKSGISCSLSKYSTIYTCYLYISSPSTPVKKSQTFGEAEQQQLEIFTGDGEGQSAVPYRSKISNKKAEDNQRRIRI